MELLVPYKVDFEEREKNKKDFIKHYENYKVNIIQAPLKQIYVTKISN